MMIPPEIETKVEQLDRIYAVIKETAEPLSDRTLEIMRLRKRIKALEELARLRGLKV